MEQEPEAPKPRRVVNFTQLCGMAKAAIEANPFMDDSEWREAIKLLLVKQGYDYPERYETLPAAMAAVERALTKLWGPRPIPEPPLPATQPRKPQQDDPPWRGMRRQQIAGRGDWTSLSAIQTSLTASPSSVTPRDAPRPESDEDKFKRQVREWQEETRVKRYWRVTKSGFEEVRVSGEGTSAEVAPPDTTQE